MSEQPTFPTPETAVAAIADLVQSQQPAPVEASPVTYGTPAGDAPAAPAEPAAPSIEAPAGGQMLTLPSGHKVALRGTRSIRNRDRKRLFDGVDPNGEDKLSAGFTILANIQKLLITAWDVRDFDDATGQPIGDILPIPSATTDDVLGGLSIEDAAALDEPAQAAQKILLPNFEPSPDDASPTQPSAG